MPTRHWLPTLCPEGGLVLHIGTLDSNRKASFHRDSLEGHGLSVSTCPDAWRRIARLGGQSLWALERQGARFLDILQLREDRALMGQIADWGIEQGLAERKRLFQAWLYDDEIESWVYSLHQTWEQAADECGEDLSEGPDGSAITTIEVLAGTPALSATMRVRDLSCSDAADYVAMAWAEAHVPDLDGVWWMEAYCPTALSAPRGAIFPNRLDRWSVSETSFDVHGDDPDAMVGPEFIEVGPGQPSSEKPRMG